MSIDSSHHFSPLDTRYKESLPESLSEEAWVLAQVDVEREWLLELQKRGLCKEPVDSAELNKIFEGITFEEVSEIEKTTQHATRALVETLIRRLQRNGKEENARWVHVGLTSFDTVDTAQRVRLKRFVTEDYLPELRKLKKTLRDLTQKHQNTPQVGRTHGQWAVPSFLGLLFSECLERVHKQEARLISAWSDLTGQASGAVGGYQASSLLVEDPLDLENSLMRRLGLKRSLSSTQILPPEDMLNLAHESFVISAVVCKLANDMRHLARSEIAEIAEGMAPGQVGSSTMPQKRNPWNFEHVCSLHKVLESRYLLLQSDLITEHQRDLTNSASGRFYSEHFSIAFLMLRRMNRVLPRVEVFEDNMQRNLNNAGGSVFAEAMYVELSKQGIDDAHSVVREGAREAERTGKDLIETLQIQGKLSKDTDPRTLRETILRGAKMKIEASLRETEKEHVV
jgi:adenylosuccinate lyase